MDQGDKVPILQPNSGSGRIGMLVPDDVASMLRLHELGWGSRRIAKEFGVSRTTVKRWLQEGQWKGYDARKRSSQLDGYEEWLKVEFLKHRGNAEVVRQELLREHNIDVSLRTVERAVKPFRQLLRAEAKATVRFETRPGHQLQADFGEMFVPVGGQRVRVYLGVVTLGYSRRTFVRAFPCQRQHQWLAMFEEAFQYFGGVPSEVLIDNARVMVDRHDVASGRVTLNPTFEAFCRYWGTHARACAPYRARTKGKDERMVQYVKSNALAGREFASWDAMDGHLQWWMREVADVRVHGTTHERPIDRFTQTEASALKALDGRPSFHSFRELHRQVRNDCCVEVDTNLYSVPHERVGERVLVQIYADAVHVVATGQLIASHTQLRGRHLRSIDPRHLAGVVALQPHRRRKAEQAEVSQPPLTPGDLQRPLEEYEQVAGGAW